MRRGHGRSHLQFDVVQLLLPLLLQFQAVSKCVRELGGKLTGRFPGGRGEAYCHLTTSAMVAPAGGGDSLEENVVRWVAREGAKRGSS